MLNKQNASTYEMAVASGITQAGLMHLVYANVAKDLLCAADAVRGGRIEARCAASRHALLLLGHLESWLGELEEPVLAETLRSFYHMLRRYILQLQAKADAADFEILSNIVMETGAVWLERRSFAPSTDAGAFTAPLSPPGGLSFHA